MELRYEQVSKSFGATTALHPLDLHVPDGCFLAMLGPSGCGKTTALRLLAGLEAPTSGRMFIGSRDVTTLQPRERTMTDAEIDAIAAKIIAEVGKKTGGVLRG